MMELIISLLVGVLWVLWVALLLSTKPRAKR